MHFLLSKKVNMRFHVFLSDFGRFLFQKKNQKNTDDLVSETVCYLQRGFFFRPLNANSMGLIG